MLHSLSRALHEEVQFDTEKVTSVDWISHPTLTPRRRAGAHRRRARERRSESEPARPAALRRRRDVCKPMLAAVANAIYDATGVRLRRVPFRDARVLAALKAAGV